MARRVVKTEAGWGLAGDDGAVVALRHGLTELLQGAPLEPTSERLDGTALLAPVDGQDVWAAGVTYERSLRAREEESTQPDVYDLVYRAERPELFFKARAEAVVGPGGEGGIRADSGWDVPEPEVVLVLDNRGAVFGYTLGDDLSSRSIEGENPLYLPQAKVYERSCVLGPGIVLASDVQPPFDIALAVRRGDAIAFEGETSTAKMHRSFEDLAQWLFRSMPFPAGVLLMTGTGVVPDDSFTLAPGDEVTIASDAIGVLGHGIRTVGA
jgi:2-dehydro-3-deoxy-D-arabinonate dehydratase